MKSYLILDIKYTFFDTTGNNEPPIVLGNAPYGYDYCKKIKHCYNDNGEIQCPSLNEIYGCENVQKLEDQNKNVVGRLTSKTKDSIKNIKNLIN